MGLKFFTVNCITNSQMSYHCRVLSHCLVTTASSMDDASRLLSGLLDLIRRGGYHVFYFTQFVIHNYSGFVKISGIKIVCRFSNFSLIFNQLYLRQFPVSFRLLPETEVQFTP